MADEKNQTNPAQEPTVYNFPELGVVVEATDLKAAEAKAKKLTEKNK